MELLHSPNVVDGEGDGDGDGEGDCDGDVDGDEGLGRMDPIIRDEILRLMCA
jgi:hypothetical protein